MNLIESSVVYFPQSDGLDGIYEQIERCGRTCYKSEDKITKGSAKKFFDRMYEGKHTAMLEHGTTYLEIFVDPNDDNYLSFESKYLKNPYSKVVYDGAKCYVTTNFRVITENLWFADVQYADKPSFHERRYTFKFTCSRAIANELVRHRVFSFAQESTRYINYSKERYGGEITFIKPSWFKENQLPLDLKVAQSSNTNGAVFYERPYKAYWIDTDADGFDWYKEDFFIHSCQTAEHCYLLMLEEGATPQQARDILPNATKTELCMTGFEDDWKYLLDLRLYQKTGAVHPDMLDLMQKLKKVMDENNIKL